MFHPATSSAMAAASLVLLTASGYAQGFVEPLNRVLRGGTTAAHLSSW
jgi:hypothetical protein